MTVSQQDELAEAITRIHSEKFTTPTLFVNVYFEDVSSHATYVGGKLRRANHIRANVRAGPSRTPEDWDELCNSIQQAWKDIVGTGLPKVKRAAPEPDTTLRSIILLGDIIGGQEAGFSLPPAGGDVKWFHENWAAFNQKAEEGDEEFQEMVEEVKARGLLGAANGDGKTAVQKLEEALGWGDSA